ncbi:SDR family oxidoreductase [Halarcobacter sp.]|uniref:SDR family NAD(P)-dependent oxidoreductase n=1 Tax=Halarcobacter sp. TaxID=2321133 RepID=UPI002AA61220|nr:SDR family oxidoreductase [Halarcobacter sp.]
MKRVLLTGGSRGIGKAIFEELKNNYEVIAPTREQLNLSSLKSIETYFESDKKIDILINSAGINIIKDIESILDNDIEKINQINLIAPLKLIQKVIPNMKKNNFGKIINISSIWGVKSKEKRTLYSGTKFGIIGQTKALSKELGEYNILVNAVCPGFTATDLTMQSLSETELLDIQNQIPLKRLAKPREIAKAIKFLISDDNSYITGQTLIIDGGFTS